MRELPEAQLVVHPRGARHMIDPTALAKGVAAVYGEERAAEMYGELLPVPEARVRAANLEPKTVTGRAKIKLSRQLLSHVDAQ